jgi:predicted N-acetyltransferase YhbS
MGGLNRYRKAFPFGRLASDAGKGVGMSDSGRTFALELVEESALPPALDRGIRELLCECFPPDVEVFSQTRHWHGTAPEYALVYRADNLLSGHVAVVRRTIRVGNRAVPIAGIQNLAVRPSFRGTGLAQALMTEAMDEARRRGVRFGLLFCVPGLERFYRNLGWVRIDAPVTMLDENGATVPIPGKNIGMTLDLSGEPFPAGLIHLEGRDW